jgi:hypothetical protein
MLVITRKKRRSSLAFGNYYQSTKSTAQKSTKCRPPYFKALRAERKVLRDISVCKTPTGFKGYRNTRKIVYNILPKLAPVLLHPLDQFLILRAYEHYKTLLISRLMCRFRKKLPVTNSSSKLLFDCVESTQRLLGYRIYSYQAQD